MSETEATTETETPDANYNVAGYHKGETVTFEWTDGSLKTGTIEGFWTDPTADGGSLNSASVAIEHEDWPTGKTHDIAVSWIRASAADFDADGDGEQSFKQFVSENATTEQ